MTSDTLIIDDLSRPPPQATIGPSWEVVSDQVMGGVSKAMMTRESVGGREAIRMRGAVRLDNNGGFVQVALDLVKGGYSMDARRWTGIELDVSGNGESYNLHLRTADIERPWQSYRHSFVAGPAWQTVRLPFQAFEAHRVSVPLDASRLRRIGIVAIGRAFTADVAVAGVSFYA
jgi:Complex I intermediate-associated protein 30 (CIA30)